MFQLNQLVNQNSNQQQQQPESNSENFYNNPNQPNNYQSIMNGLKMMNLQSSAAAASAAATQHGPLNPAVMSLFNKENLFNSSGNSPSSQLSQLNMNSNLLNMFKSAAAAQQSSELINDSLGNLASILNLNGMSMNNVEAKKIAASNGNEQMEGTIAIVANKRAITSQYNVRTFFSYERMLNFYFFKSRDIYSKKDWVWVFSIFWVVCKSNENFEKFILKKNDF